MLEEPMSEEDVKIEAVQYLAELHTVLYEYHKDLLKYAFSQQHILDIEKMFDQNSTNIKNQITLVKNARLACQTYTIGKTDFQVMLFTSDDHPDSEIPSK